MFNTLKVISQDMGLILYFTYRLKYKQTKYGENMTETSSKSVLRSTTIMFLFVGLVGIWMGGCQTQEQNVDTQEQKIERLIKQLQDQNKDVRIYAAFALGMIGEEAIDAVSALIQALQDQNPEVRGDAVQALGSIGSGAEDAVPALIQTLQDQDPSIRQSVALALGQIGTPEAIKVAVLALIQTLQDQDAEVRGDAVQALGKIGAEAKDAVPALIQTLK
ncbi:TPA: hypothetical protein EYN09_20810, partial [Candidatus Poribacteria bacterium]|nr:hypothetical protein [Candidatus Poribacteria bacterium]